MSPGKNNQIANTVSPSPGLPLLLSCLTLAAVTLLSTGCAVLTGGIPSNRVASMGGGILKGLRPAADPALVERIRENEMKEAQAAQITVATQTAGAQIIQPGLGRNLPKVSTDPLSASYTTTQNTANGTMLATNNQDQANNAFANQAAQMATYESSYSTVPPPPPGSLAAGLVPPPPAVTLSTQAQTYGGGSAADFYNNPYFNPYGVPAPPQAVMPERRPAGLFGEGGTRSQSESSVEKANPKHRADFVPITPTGMEVRSPYKQRDDIRVLWRAALKDSNDAGAIEENKRLLADLAKLDVGLPADSSRGSFNVSSRQIESLFKSSVIDKRAFPEVRKIQADLVQSYYRYLCAYNKYALAEQTTAARQQEVDLSESDLERQKGTADLAQAKNDLDSAKDDMLSAEFELAAASSPTAARTIISRVAGVAPSVESLAQGSSQSGSRLAASRGNHITNVFESMFHHNHSSNTTTANSNDSVADATTGGSDKPRVAPLSRGGACSARIASSSKHKTSATAKSDDDQNWVASMFSSKHSKKSKSDEISKTTDDNSDLSPAPVAKVSKSTTSEDSLSDNSEPVSKSISTNNNTVSFELKGVNIKPRKSVLTVSVKNSSNEAYELNPDAICISEGNHKLATADMRADFDMTSIQPDHEVKGTITVFGHPWNDRLLVYLNDGNKKIQLKR